MQLHNCVKDVNYTMMMHMLLDQINKCRYEDYVTIAMELE